MISLGLSCKFPDELHLVYRGRTNISDVQGRRVNHYTNTHAVLFGRTRTCTSARLRSCAEELGWTPACKASAYTDFATKNIKTFTGHGVRWTNVQQIISRGRQLLESGNTFWNWWRMMESNHIARGNCFTDSHRSQPVTHPPLIGQDTWSRTRASGFQSRDASVTLYPVKISGLVARLHLRQRDDSFRRVLLPRGLGIPDYTRSSRELILP